MIIVETHDASVAASSSCGVGAVSVPPRRAGSTRFAHRASLLVLREGDATVSELQDAVGASQQNVSKHLGILHNAGIVTRAKQGNHARYAIADEGVFELCEQVCGDVRRQLDELDALLPNGA
jgi:DNA-binding transcriptional ArsR family regulator